MFFELPPAPPAIIVQTEVASSSCVPFDWCRYTSTDDGRGSGRVEQEGKN